MSQCGWKPELFSTFWWEKGKMGMENNQLLHYNHSQSTIHPLSDISPSGKEPSGSIKCGEFLDQLTTCKLLKDSVPWSKSAALLISQSTEEPSDSHMAS
jgi:hypothetical protein